MSDRDDYAEARAAEQGYQESSLREVRLRDWFSGRDDPRKDRDFQRLVDRLKTRKWYRANRERALSYARAYALRLRRDPARRRAHLAKKRTYQRRYYTKVRRAEIEQRKSVVYTCAAPDCGVQWSRVPWRRALSGDRHFCTPNCRERTRYHEDAGHREVQKARARQRSKAKTAAREPRRVARCSICREQGHYRVTCPRKEG